MRRYSGEDLGLKPHIVVLGSCKVGNFVVSTPVLRGLRARFTDSVIGFVGSEVTADFEAAFSSINWRLSWDDESPGSSLKLQQDLFVYRKLYGPVSLAINLDGFNPITSSLVPSLEPFFVAGASYTLNRRAFLPSGDLPEQRFLDDPDWDSEDFLFRYQTVFRTQYIAELFCRMAFVADFVDPAVIDLPTKSPTFHVPELLIHCTTARGAKLWSFESWLQVIRAAGELGWGVGLVGSKSVLQKNVYNGGDLEDRLLAESDLIDLRGQTSLIELAGALKLASAVISVDAGPLHIASAVGTPTMAVVGNDASGTGASPIRLWMPRSTSVARTFSTFSCSLCSDNRYKNDECLVQGHPCMTNVDSGQVIEWLRHLVDARSAN